MKFRPDIEGLRAFAIVPVVVFHAFPSVLPGGFVGVDVFFVISGYLITSLLLQRMVSDRYSVLSFYGARIRRIFPALFAMLGLLVPAALYLLPPKELGDFARTMGATALFVSNIELYRTTGYFDGAAELKPLLHTWSLAVEEQYYIVFPLFLALLVRRKALVTTGALLTIGILSLGASTWWLRNDASLAFYSAISRTFELMMGSLLAIRLQAVPLSPGGREFVAGAGLVAIATSCALYSPATLFPGPAALLPCAGAVLVIWAGSEGQTWTGRLVSSVPFRWIGSLSFSLYLWHWPVLVFTRHFLLKEPEAWQSGIAVVVAVALAQASLRWIETPVRRAVVSDRGLVFAGFLGICCALVGAWALTQHAVLQRKEPSKVNFLLDGALDSNPHRARCHGGERRIIDYADRCRFGATDGPTRIAVWADSHGAELALALGELLAPGGERAAQISSSSCPPAPGFAIPTRPLCVQHNESTLMALVADPEVEVVVMVARYGYYFQFGETRFEAALQGAIRALGAAGKRVLLVDPFPAYSYPVPSALAMLERRGSGDAGFGQTTAEYRLANKATLDILERLGRLPNVTRVRTSDVICGTGVCAVTEGGHPLYFDDNHFSMAGARRLAEAMKPQFGNAAH